jgi:hypothetical protein
LTILIFVLLIILIEGFYKRYVPVSGIRCSEIESVSGEQEKVILDIRDYNASYKDVFEDAINIPISYLKRYAEDIPNKDVHIVASNVLEKNVGIRLLRKKGFAVTGFTLSDGIDERKYQSKGKIETCC